MKTLYLTCMLLLLTACEPEVIKEQPVQFSPILMFYDHDAWVDDRELIREILIDLAGRNVSLSIRVLPVHDSRPPVELKWDQLPKLEERPSSIGRTNPITDAVHARFDQVFVFMEEIQKRFDQRPDKAMHEVFPKRVEAFIREYGFDGTKYIYAPGDCARLLGNQSVQQILCGDSLNCVCVSDEVPKCIENCMTTITVINVTSFFESLTMN